jgi:hypothetical protein
MNNVLSRLDLPGFIACLLNSWSNHIFLLKKTDGGETFGIVAVPTKQGGHAQLTVGASVKSAFSEASALVGAKVLVHVVWAVGIRLVFAGELTRSGKNFTVVAGVPHVPFTFNEGEDFSHKLAPSRPSTNGSLLTLVRNNNSHLELSTKEWESLESIECHGETGQEAASRNQARKICSLRGRPDQGWVLAGLLCRCYHPSDGPKCEFW